MSIESSKACMPRKNQFKKKLQDGETVLACWISSMAPASVEILGQAGFDGVVFDAEHFPYDALSLENLIRAADSVGVTPIVKIPRGGDVLLTHAIDSGAMGVHFAEVRTAEEAHSLVQKVRYYPAGHRGLSFSHRAARYQMLDSHEYMKAANEEIMAVIVIENVTALGNLDEILEVPGVDVISIGPHDLSHSMGIPDQINHPRMQDAFETIIGKATAKGLPVGSGAWTEDMIDERIRWGMRYIHWSDDLRLMTRSALEVSKFLRSLK